MNKIVDRWLARDSQMTKSALNYPLVCVQSIVQDTPNRDIIILL